MWLFLKAKLRYLGGMTAHPPITNQPLGSPPPSSSTAALQGEGQQPHNPQPDELSADLSGDDLTPIEPRYIWVMRASMAFSALFTLAMVAAADILLMPQLGWPQGIATGVLLLIWLLAIIILPSRRVLSIRYQLADDHIRVRRGFLFTVDSIVPFVRVQHLDVSQGMIERSLSLSSLTVHTSGVLNEAVTLPGLETGLAHEMRETIRRHILTDFA